jgi:hypothetical protein
LDDLWWQSKRFPAIDKADNRRFYPSNLEDIMCRTAIRATALAAALAALMLAPGCDSKKIGVIFKSNYSCNLAFPDVNWPGNPERTLTPVQQEIYKEWGRPDLIRFWWNTEDDFVGLFQIPSDPTPEELAEVKQSWIYKREFNEIVFDGPVTSVAMAIDDRLAVVIGYGDPENRRFTEGPGGVEQEVWHFYSRGRQVTFQGEKLIEDKRVHDPMPGYRKK